MRGSFAPAKTLSDFARNRYPRACGGKMLEETLPAYAIFTSGAGKRLGSRYRTHVLSLPYSPDGIVLWREAISLSSAFSRRCHPLSGCFELRPPPALRP